MKKILSLVILYSVALVFGQQSKVTFNKKLVYEFHANSDNSKSFNGNQIAAYTNGQAYLVSVNEKAKSVQYFADSNGISSVNIGLNNVLNGYLDPSLLFMSAFGEDQVNDQKFAAVNLNSQKTIAGNTCNEYLLKPVFGQNHEEDEDNIKVCINEDSNFNSIPTLSALMSYGKTTQVDFLNLSGLVVKISTESQYDTDYLALKSIENTDTSVFFDNKANIAKQKKAMDSLKTVYSRDYAVDSTMAVVDSAAAAVESAMGEYYIDSPNYESTYKKNRNESEINLAIDNLPHDNLWNIIPSHCRKIDESLPQFENKELKQHLKNYVGQVCDLYLSQEEYNNVDEKGTIDEIRREVLYLNEIREKLSKSDKNKLDKYLKNLD